MNVVGNQVPVERKNIQAETEITESLAEPLEEILNNAQKLQVKS